MTISKGLSDNRPRLFIDLETYSGVDLKTCGLYKYVESPDFRILLIAWALDGEDVQVVDVDNSPSTCPQLVRLRGLLRNKNVVKVAHNCAFERTCLTRYLEQYMPPEEWEDTMHLAAMNGLPLTLAGVGEALGLEQQKLKEGEALIRYFCKPRPVTAKADGQLTLEASASARRVKSDAPDKWERFMYYNRVDVEVERTVYRRLAPSTPITPFERMVFEADARINERGVLVDVKFARAALKMQKKFEEAAREELLKRTGLANPNSVPQLRDWLQRTAGIECTTLDKKAIEELRRQPLDTNTDRVLELRQQLGKTSTKKYTVMLRAACDDNRVRGITQYYGAGRTGRWAGRLVQMQNLPQNHLDQIAEVRGLVRREEYTMLTLLYDSIPDVLSQLIRTAFVARKTFTLLVADYSAIEARVIAYLAGEAWRLQAFADGKDIYCQSASQMFHVPVEKHGVNAHLRQKGKIAELACIAEGSLVLTDKGLVPIEQITPAHRLWDGEAWVEHDGVVYRGEKEVITYEGLTATPDHVVWTREYGTIPFRIAAARCAHLVQTGAGGNPVRLGGDHQRGEAVEQTVEPLLCAHPLHRVRFGSVDGVGEPDARQIKGLSKLLRKAAPVSDMAGSEIHGGEAEVHKPERRGLQELRRARHRVPFSFGRRRVSVHGGNLRHTGQEDGDRQDRRQRTLRAGEPALGDASAELREPAAVPREVRVFDIVNAGKHHRFTVSGVLVHNCGYGGGVAALKAFGADKMGLSDAEMQEIVDQWRAASPQIPRLWRRIEEAAVHALEDRGKSFTVQRKVYDPDRAAENESATGGDGFSPYFNAGSAICTFKRDKDALRCTLPSGRRLSYWDAKLEHGNIMFRGVGEGKKFVWLDTWGGKLVENIVQAFARDCLATALVRLDKAGYRICFHVHDEIIAEAPAGARWEDMAAVMSAPIKWAPGLQLPADGYSTVFYKKE